MRNLLLKIFFVVFVSSSLALPAFETKAQTSGSAVGAIDDALPTVPVKDRVAEYHLDKINSGIGGDPLAKGVQSGIKAARESLKETCVGVVDSLSKSGSVEGTINQVSNASVSLIGGGVKESKDLSVKLAKATVALNCVNEYLKILQAQGSQNLLQASEVAREEVIFSQYKATLEKLISDLEARLNASVKDILRAFMVKLILNLNKSLTTQVVNGLVQKYRIEDYLAYGDAVATQIYSMKYINENYSGDARTQMMLRSLVQSEKFPEQATTAITFANTIAKEELNKSCNGVQSVESSTTEDYLRCMAAFGSEKTSPVYQYMTALDKSNVVLAAAKDSAAKEIAASNGFAPPRNCSGSIAQQQQIDAAYKQATNQMKVAAKTEIALNEAYQKNKTDAQKAELDKAKAARIQAGDNLDALVKQKDSPIVDICKAINSPGSYVADQINKFLEQHLDQSSRLQSDNLPFYANFMADVASNFLTNLIVGGKSTGQVFKEAGYQALGGTIVAVSEAQRNAGGTTGNVPITAGGLLNYDVKIYAREIVNGGQLPNETTNLQVGKKYVMYIDFRGLINSGDPNQIPYRIQINGIDDVPLNISPTASEIKNGVVTFDVSNLDKPFTLKVMMYSKLSETPESPIRAEPWVQEFGVSRVQGAVTVNWNPRGAFAPRGY